MIVHSDTDEDETQRGVKPESSAPHHGPITRTRKAQDARLRLGVGRPSVVGGQGARTVTRSVGIAKGVRSRSGRGVKPTQDPIVEGSSGQFFPMVFNFPRTFNHLSGRSVLPRLIIYETSHEHLTGTTEEALQPQSNRESPQPQANESSTARSSPRRDVGSSQAGVRALVEEQVWTTACPLSLFSSYVAHPSVGTAPTAHNSVPSETTSATSISACSRSGRAE